MTEINIDAIAAEIVADNGGSAFFLEPEGWENIPQKDQDAIMEIVYQSIDYCAGCGWVWWTEDMDIVDGELMCSQCAEEDEDE